MVTLPVVVKTRTSSSNPSRGESSPQNPASITEAVPVTKKGKRATLKRIADMVGVSKMTVSRALREGTSVDETLRARIRETAERIGYRHDVRISQVMSAIHKSQAPPYRETLALVWTHRRSEEDPSDTYYREVMHGATRRAEQLGYKLDQIWVAEESITGRALSRILQSRGIRGALIAPPATLRAYSHVWLDWPKFCCVLIGRSFVNKGLARVLPDHYLNCVLAMRRLRRLHYQRIGLVLSRSMDERSIRLVRSAFLSFHPLGLRRSASLVFTGNGIDAAKLLKWIAKAKPEVVIANFEKTFPRIEQLQTDLPRGIDLITLNWNRGQTGLSGVDQRSVAIGEQALDLLLLRLQHNLFGLDELAPVINVPGVWVQETSLRKISPITVEN